ncbi:hypothetical protein NIES2130_10415 [Scytonema sp. HK-05]|nr:hypothetical protein NIES2130_10415 [Scytonema sp. HK-05]
MYISFKTKTAIAVIAKVSLVIIDIFLKYAPFRKYIFKDFVKRIVKKQQLYGSTDNLGGFY